MDDFATNAISCLVIFVIFFLAIFVGMFIHFSGVGEGEHTGYVTAIDKTWLWQNNIVYFKTDASSSQEDDYCVSRGDKELVEQLKAASKAKSLVTISYHGVRAFGIGICTGTQIDGIK